MPDSIYRSSAVANYLIKAAPDGLDALQVMKLTYIAHGFTLGLLGRPLIEDDIEAWKLGPVVRRIYQALPGGSHLIRKPLSDDAPDINPEERAIVDDVLR